MKVKAVVKKEKFKDIRNYSYFYGLSNFHGHYKKPDKKKGITVLNIELRPENDEERDLLLSIAPIGPIRSVISSRSIEGHTSIMTVNDWQIEDVES